MIIIKQLDEWHSRIIGVIPYIYINISSPIMGRAKKLECSVLMEYHAFQVDTFRGIDNQRISIIHIVALSFSINIT